MAKKAIAAAVPAEVAKVSEKQGEETAAAAAVGETEWELADPDWVREDYENYEGEAAERKARGAVVKPEKGKTTWRVLPPLRGTKRLFWRPWVHSINNEVLEKILRTLSAMPDNVRGELSKELSVIDFSPSTLDKGFSATYCPLKMKDEPCVRCKLTSVLFRLERGSAALAYCKNLANEIKSKEEFFVNAVRMDKPDEMEKGPRILQLTIGVFEGMNKIFLGQETEEQLAGDYSHPATGFNLVIERIVDEKNPVKINDKMVPKTSYTVAAGRSRGALKNMDWLKSMHDLTKAREWPDDVSFRGVLEGDGAPAKDPEDDPYGTGIAPAGQGRQLAAAPAAGGDDWIEDPENAGDFDYRRNLRAKGRKV